jgi:hypothetical protein
MTPEPRHLLAPQTRMLTARRPNALPTIAAVASHALPAVTASVAAAATMLTVERVVRKIVERIAPISESTPRAAQLTASRTTITEWFTIERSRRSN